MLEARVMFAILCLLFLEQMINYCAVRAYPELNMKGTLFLIIWVTCFLVICPHLYKHYFLLVSGPFV